MSGGPQKMVEWLNGARRPKPVWRSCQCSIVPHLPCHLCQKPAQTWLAYRSFYHAHVITALHNAAFFHLSLLQTRRFETLQPWTRVTASESLIAILTSSSHWLLLVYTNVSPESFKTTLQTRAQKMSVCTAWKGEPESTLISHSWNLHLSSTAISTGVTTLVTP